MYTKALLTDLYQLTMMQGLFFEGKHEQQCVFDRYYRTNPFQGGYTVVAGWNISSIMYTIYISVRTTWPI